MNWLGIWEFKFLHFPLLWNGSLDSTLRLIGWQASDVWERCLKGGENMILSMVNGLLVAALLLVGICFHEFCKVLFNTQSS